MLLQKKKSLKDSVKAADEPDDDDIDTHQMLKTNCIFRNPIKAMLKELKSFNQKRKDLEDKYAQMRREVFKLK